MEWFTHDNIKILHTTTQCIPRTKRLHEPIKALNQLNQFLLLIDFIKFFIVIEFSFVLNFILIVIHVTISRILLILWRWYICKCKKAMALWKLIVRTPQPPPPPPTLFFKGVGELNFNYLPRRGRNLKNWKRRWKYGTGAGLLKRMRSSTFPI